MIVGVMVVVLVVVVLLHRMTRRGPAANPTGHNTSPPSVDPAIMDNAVPKIPLLYAAIINIIVIIIAIITTFVVHALVHRLRNDVYVWRHYLHVFPFQRNSVNTWCLISELVVFVYVSVRGKTDEYVRTIVVFG